MRLILTCLFIGLISCQSDNQIKKLDGIWCNETNHCIYFNNTNCIIDKAKVYKFSKLSNQEIELDDKKTIKYKINIENGILKIKNFTSSSFRNYKKIITKNNQKIREIYFAQNSESSNFEANLNKESKLQLRINFHDKFESGDYVSEIPLELTNFIFDLINSTNLNVEPNLNKEIISDLQEWGLMIKSDKEYSIYHNYEQIDINHKNLAFLLEKLPYFTKLEHGKINTDLEEIRKYRETEFKRNKKENDL